jgi:small subunit ribosomal protein S9
MTETAIEGTETAEPTEAPEATEAPEPTEASEVTETVEVAETVEVQAEAAPSYEPHDLGRPIQTVGRRKEAVVRVRLVPGTGKFDLDGRTLEAYFPNKVHQQLIKAPLVTVDRVDNFDVYAHLDGGGPSGQAGALRLAISRALIIVQPEDRPALKKARKAPQYSKR